MSWVLTLAAWIVVAAIPVAALVMAVRDEAWRHALLTMLAAVLISGAVVGSVAWLTADHWRLW